MITVSPRIFKDIQSAIANGGNHVEGVNETNGKKVKIECFSNKTVIIREGEKTMVTNADQLKMATV